MSGWTAILGLGGTYAATSSGGAGSRSGVKFLEQGGFTTAATGGSPRGEIDVIARDGADTGFVEVKTRSSGGFGDIEAEITASLPIFVLIASFRATGSRSTSHPSKCRNKSLDSTA